MSSMERDAGEPRHPDEDWTHTHREGCPALDTGYEPCTCGEGGTDGTATDDRARALREWDRTGKASRIFATLKDIGVPMDRNTIAEAADIPLTHVGYHLGKLVDAGIVVVDVPKGKGTPATLYKVRRPHGTTPWRLDTPARERAIVRLEAALRECERAGVALVGMDDQIIAQAVHHLPDPDNRSSSPGYPVDRDRPHTTVEDHGAYVDSGGW